MSRRFTPSLAPVGRLISAQPVGLEQTGASGFPEFIFARGAFNLDTQPSERIYIYIYVYSYFQVESQPTSNPYAL